MDVIHEIEPEYAGRVTFQVVPPAETARRADELQRYGLAELKHGLVALDAEGEFVDAIPGHRFGRAEIEEVVRKLLREA